MQRLVKHKLLVGVIAVVLAAGAGAAYAATQSSGNPQQALLNDVAKRLNVSPAQLRSAIQGALLDRLAAAVKAGELTQAQANQIKQRIEQGGPLPFGPLGPGMWLVAPGLWGHAHGFGQSIAPPGLLGPRHGPLGAAANYLGLSVNQLLNKLQGGKTLAEIAQAQSKSVSGLEQVLVADAKARLDRMVSAGWLTKAQAQQRLSRLSGRINQIVQHGRIEVPRFRAMPGGSIVSPGAVPAPPAPGPGPFGSPPPGA
jgi:hypothetical protein